jgi:hypothetical protein
VLTDRDDSTATPSTNGDVRRRRLILGLGTSDPAARRKTTLAIGLAAVVVAAAVGWLAGRQIRSPAEEAARTAPPAASLIPAEVQRLTLSSDVVTRGTVRFGSPRAVSVPASALKPGTSIVTSAPVKGAELREGDVSLTLSGRPVFVLKGAQPAYRDLVPGTSGADVRQLQEALGRLGFDPGTRSGFFGQATAAAVAKWYEAAGWSPYASTDEQLQALHAAEADVFAAQADLVTAQEGVTAARRDAAQARTTAESFSGPKPADVTATEWHRQEAAAKWDAKLAEEAVATARRGEDVAHNRVASARRLTRQLTEKLGVQVPADEVLFFPNFPLRVDDTTVVNGDEVGGPVMTVSNSQLAVEGSLSADDAKYVRVGALVAIDDVDLNVHGRGMVVQIADKPGTNGVDPDRYFVSVVPGPEVTPALAGASVVLTITVRDTGGDVLAVPVTAVSVAGDGSSRVQVDEGAGRTRYVKVKLGLSAKGMVAVEPIGGRLAEGESVVVGTTGVEAKK